MTDANDALRALEDLERRFHWRDDTISRHVMSQLSIIRARLTDPGYVRVPVEPTKEMLVAGWEALVNKKGNSCHYWKKPLIAYQAMLAAATKETSHD